MNVLADILYSNKTKIFLKNSRKYNEKRIINRKTEEIWAGDFDKDRFVWFIISVGSGGLKKGSLYLGLGG